MGGRFLKSSNFAPLAVQASICARLCHTEQVNLIETCLRQTRSSDKWIAHLRLVEARGCHRCPRNVAQRWVFCDVCWQILIVGRGQSSRLRCMPLRELPQWHYVGAIDGDAATDLVISDSGSMCGFRRSVSSPSGFLCGQTTAKRNVVARVESGVQRWLRSMGFRCPSVKYHR